MRKALIMLAILFGFASSNSFAESEDLEIVHKNSQEFAESYSSSIKALMAKNFEDGLVAPSLGAVTSSEFQNLLNAIKAETPIPAISAGETAIVYDVILQPGHYARKTGAVGAEGRLVSERALVSFIVARTAEILSKQTLKILVIPADNFLKDNPLTPNYDGLQSKIFLAVHADGSPVSCKTGPSLSYEANSSMMAMHAIGWGLAQSLGYTYEDFRKDNFTVNAARYYMFRNLRAKTMKGLLEIGEITCKETEERLIANANAIAANLARAIKFISE